jgi:1,4-alpha-glucan branching enzyme
MLAQSSDWAFYLDAGTMPAYAARRFQGHLDRMNRLLDAVEQGRVGGGDAEPPPYGRRLLPTLKAAWYRSGGTAPEPERAAAPAGQRQQHRLRVLMLAWEYPPHIVGGLGKAVGDLAQELAAQGRDVHVITRAPDDAAAPRAAVEFGVTVHRVPVPPSLEPVPFIDWVFRMNVAFAAYASHLFAHGAHFDVVHAHDWLVAAAAAELRAAAQLPLVATVHATEYGRRGGCLAGPVSPHLHAQEARLLAAADEVIVCSEAMRAELRRAHPDAPAQPRVIPCGHNAPAPDAAAGAASPLALPPRSADAPVLAFLGRLVPEKGVQVLLTALPHLLARYPALTLVIAGEGPQRPELEALAAPFGERVRFAGFLAGEAKAALLARADLTVMPSLYEPFGLVALEAMMAGTPLLASAVGGLADIVTHGADGELVPPGDADALAERTLAMLGDAAYRSKLAAAAQQTVRERYSMKLVAEQTVRVYETAIARQESQQGHV